MFDVFITTVPLTILVGSATFLVFFFGCRQSSMNDDDWSRRVPPPKDDDATTIRFQSGNATLVGHLHIPPNVVNDESSSCPVVIFCMGLGLTQDSNLQDFIQDVVATGNMAAFTFDYRTFGESEGSPRHQVKPRSHIQDILAAIDCMRHHPKVDRIGLWGSSLGGGHVLAVAAHQDPSVEAVVSLVPHTRSALEVVLGTIFRNPLVSAVGVTKLCGALLLWMLRGCLCGLPTYVPLHGPPGSPAMMQNPGDDEGYRSIAPTNSQHWRNAATVGSIPAVLFYRPINRLRKNNSVARTPAVLLIVAENDTLCPAAGGLKASTLIPNSQVLELKGKGHFDVYSGSSGKTVMEATAAFFRQNLASSDK